MNTGPVGKLSLGEDVLMKGEKGKMGKMGRKGEERRGGEEGRRGGWEDGRRGLKKG